MDIQLMHFQYNFPVKSSILLAKHGCIYTNYIVCTQIVL